MKYINNLFLLILFSSCSQKQYNQIIESKPLNNSSLERIAFGSCNKEWKDQSYWGYIEKTNPDLWIWTGDIIYADTEDMTKLKERYDGLKNNEYYSSFRQKTPILGIWDDHDYGVNDGGKEYPMKKESKEILFDFLDVNKNNEAWKREGAYQSYTFGKVDKEVKIFLLDARYFRDHLEAKPGGPERYHINKTGDILGEDQWNWLENELKNSKARANIIIGGIQFLSTEQNFEKWANFPTSRNRLLKLIGETNNVILISGDRHISELAKIDLSPTKSIHEITSSGLTHSYTSNREPNQYRVSPIIGDKSFGVLDFDWKTDELLVKLSFLSMNGKEIYKHQWKLNE